MIRRLRFAFRTLVGPWLVVAAAAMEISTFLMRGMPWRGEGMWTVEWFAISLFLIGPVSAGAAAVDAARLSRPGNLHLVVGVPRQGRVYLRAAAWCAGPLVAVHLLTILVALLVGQVSRPSVSWGSLAGAALVQCLVIVWYVALGSAVGRFTPPIIAGLLSGAGAFVLSYVIGDATSGDQFRLLALGAATVSRIGRDYDWSYLAPQLVVLVGMAALLLLIPVRGRSGVRTPGPAGVAQAGLALLVLVVAGAVLPAERTFITAPQAPTHCVGAAPEVCVYHEHRRFMPVLHAQTHALARPALAAGYSSLVPGRIVEYSRAYAVQAPGTASVWLPVEMYEENRMPIVELAYQLIEPEQCPRLRSEVPPTEEYDKRIFSVLATWLHVAGVQVDHPYPVETRILDPARVATIMAEFQRCELDGPV